MSNFGLILSYILVAVAALGWIGGAVMNLIGDTKALIRSGIIVGGIIVLYFISYALAGNEVTAKYAQFGIDASSSQSIGAVLTLMYILLFGAIAGIIYTEVGKFFK